MPKRIATMNLVSLKDGLSSSMIGPQTELCRTATDTIRQERLNLGHPAINFLAKRLTNDLICSLGQQQNTRLVREKRPSWPAVSSVGTHLSQPPLAQTPQH